MTQNQKLLVELKHLINLEILKIMRHEKLA